MQPTTVKPAAAPYSPAAHDPLHAVVPSAEVAPYVPAGQSVHVLEPAKEYRPATHAVTVAVTDPMGHVYPAAHWPEHVELLSPAEAPKKPAGQLKQDPNPDVL